MPHRNVQWSHCDFCLNTGNGIIPAREDILAFRRTAITKGGDFSKILRITNEQQGEGPLSTFKPYRHESY